MTISPSLRHVLDRVALVLTAVAVLILLAVSVDAVAGPTNGPRVLVRVLLAGFVVARILPWLKAQHAKNAGNVAGPVALAAFFGTLYALLIPGVDTASHMLGRFVILFGVPAWVLWKLDPAIFNRIHRRAQPPDQQEPAHPIP